MAENIGISSYVIRLYAKGDRKKVLKFRSLPLAAGKQLADYLFEYLSDLTENSHEGTTLRNISIRNDKEQKPILFIDKHRVHGLLDYGKFGYTSTLKDRKTRAVNYERKTTDTEVIPMYFLLSVPKDKKKGVFLFQNYGLSGIKTVMDEYLTRRFKKDFPNYTLIIRPFLDQELKRTMLRKGKIVSASIFSPNSYSDKADAVMNADAGEAIYFETVMRSKKRGVTLDSLQAAIIKKMDKKKSPTSSDFNDIISLEDVAELRGVPKDDIEGFKVKVKYNGKEREVSLLGFGGRAIRFNVNDNVELGLDGHPKLASIHSEALTIESDIIGT